jgi:peptidoglycan/xylan/chitin deacetylase (PgdA/CDA1 family)
MFNASILIRARDAYRRKRSAAGGRHLIDLRLTLPIVSFTFDDFPRSAAHPGGAILKQHRMHGTYYVSLGMMDSELPAGRSFSEQDLRDVAKEGHELGCHTFAHCHAWETKPMAFEESIIKNKYALSRILPEACFGSLSYPIAMPRPDTKERAAKYYPCCRGGGEKINVGVTDRNNLSACFLEKNRDKPEALKRLIDENVRLRGWLIFATHDIAAKPSPFGCTPQFFEQVVSYTATSGTTVLPVREAWDTMLQGESVSTASQK